MQAQTPLISCVDLFKKYRIASLEVTALQNFNLDILPGEMVSLVGDVGSGKSTVLQIISGVDVPSGGRVSVSGYDLQSLTGDERLMYRRRMVGVVWQHSLRYLLSYLGIRENIEQPMIFNTDSPQQRKEWCMVLFNLLNLGDHLDTPVNMLSLHEQRLVTIAVAMANNPPLLLLDEPTEQLLPSLFKINEILHTTILITTQNPMMAGKIGRVVGMSKGDSALLSPKLNFNDPLSAT